MKRKRVLIYSQAFFPDHSGIPIYSSDFAFYCAENGYDVDVITSFPFYPHWQKRKEDKYKFFAKDVVDRVSIYRGYMYASPNPSSFERIIHELSLVLFAFVNSWRVKRPDAIVVFTTPVLLGVLAAFMNLIWRRKLIINVQDFQIEAAYSLKMLKASFFLKLLNRLELWSYRKADYVSSISQSMVDMLVTNKNLPSEKILFWPNWIQYNLNSNQSPCKNTFREQFDIPSEVCLVGYAGNIGKKQGLEILIDVAKEFSSQPNLLFLIVGEGSGLESLKNYTSAQQLTNVRFLPFLNSKEYQEYLIDVNAVFIPQAKVPFDIYFPSKLLGIMAFGRLIIISADINSELFKTMKRNNLALVANYGDIDSLKHYVNNVVNNQNLTVNYVERAREFVKQYERNYVLSNTIKLIFDRPQRKDGLS